MKLLFVDDNALVLTAILRAARKRGHELTLKTSGWAAVEALEGGARFDVIVLDHAMPGVHGHELVEAIRKIDPRVPIVALTGTKPDAVGHGYDAIFEKPMPVDELFEALRAFLNGGRHD